MNRRNFCLLASGWLLSGTMLATSAGADDSLPPETVAAIKAATVFVKVEADGLSGSASGFVIKTEGDAAYIVTNHHVIEPKEVQVIVVPNRTPVVPYRPPMTRPHYVPVPMPRVIRPSYSYTPRIMVRTIKNAVVTVVFHSGSDKEQSIRGEIVAADPEQDLAVVKVAGVKELPKPIDYLHEPKLSETMPIYTFGFPFGKALATSKGGPAITVGKGSVSSLRMNDDGELAVVQIDGALNPGNSGGPVVDTQGRLVGVAVATIRDSSGIGLAIPGRELSQMLQGRVGKVYLYSTQDAAGLATIHVEIGLIDPLDKIKSAELHYLIDNSLKDKPKPADPLAPLAGCRKLPLKLEKHLATGEFTVERGVTSVSLLHQAVYVNESGKPALTKNVTETIRAAAAVAAVPPAAPNNQPVVASPAENRPSTPTQIFGGGIDPQFRDAAPAKGLLVGFDVGLGKWAGNDVVYAIRPVFVTSEGQEILGQQHGADTSRVTRVKAKSGYAVGAVTVKTVLAVDGLSVTFMKIDKDRLNPKDAYESDWIGGKGSGPQTRLGGDGTAILGIVGKQNSRDFTGLGLLLAAAGTAGPAMPATPPAMSVAPPAMPITPPPVAARGPGQAIHYRPGPLPPPPGIAALDADRVTRNLPEPIDEVVAGGGGRCLLFHLPKLRKLAVFDVAEARITRYLSLGSDDVLYAAGSEKLVVVSRDQNVIQRYDLASLQKELTVSLPEVGQVEGIALGYASAGPALLATQNGPKFLDVTTLSVIEPPADAVAGKWIRSSSRHSSRQRLAQIRASADGSTFAAADSLRGRNAIWTLDGDTAHCRFEPSNAVALQPGFDGSLFFGRTGLYSADLQPVSPEQFRNVTCFPAYHPAYFLSVSGSIRGYNPNPTDKPKLSLYTSGDKRRLVSFTEFDELYGPPESPINGVGSMTVDKRVHFFPTANLLVIVSAQRDQLVLRKLDVTAALEKAGIDYLYVTSSPPATASPGSALAYAVEVKSRQGGVHCTLDSGPEGMTLSDDGKLHWKVPAGEPAGRQAVIITVKDASGQEILHSFNIATR